MMGVLHDVVHAVQRPQERTFPTATGTNQRRDRSLRNKHRDVVQGLSFPIEEVQIPRLDLHRMRFRIPCRGGARR